MSSGTPLDESNIVSAKTDADGAVLYETKHASPFI
jgi:hypothetical protein